MSNRPKFSLAALTALTLVTAGTAVISNIAEAKGKPVTVTLSCTNAVGSATAVVQLQSSIFGGPASNTVTIDCGSASLSGLASNSLTLKATSLPAGYVSYSISQSTPAAGGCIGQSIRPLATTCNTGITLTVS